MQTPDGTHHTHFSDWCFCKLRNSLTRSASQESKNDWTQEAVLYGQKLGKTVSFKQKGPIDKQLGSKQNSVKAQWSVWKASWAWVGSAPLPQRRLTVTRQVQGRDSSLFGACDTVAGVQSEVRGSPVKDWHWHTGASPAKGHQGAYKAGA